ncbi:MAG: hypothetical protein WC523_00435 [Patescibacteria group bacterium]
MSIVIILQARSQSTRFPRKIYADLNGKYSIQRILSGCKKTIYPNKIILAMPAEDKIEIESRIAKGEMDNFIDDRFSLFIGPGEQNDLVDRFYRAARLYHAEVIVRLTCDNPMYEGFSDGIDEMIEYYLLNDKKGFLGNNDAICKANPYPHGVDVEIFNYRMLCWAKLNIHDKYNLEHCAPSFYKPTLRFGGLEFRNEYRKNLVSTSIPKFTMDTEEDYKLLLKLTKNYDICQDLNKSLELTYEEIK